MRTTRTSDRPSTVDVTQRGKERGRDVPWCTAEGAEGRGGGSRPVQGGDGRLEARRDAKGFTWDSGTSWAFLRFSLSSWTCEVYINTAVLAECRGNTLRGDGQCGSPKRAVLLGILR